MLDAISRQNVYWINATGRLSSDLRVQFLRRTSDETTTLYRELDRIALGGLVMVPPRCGGTSPGNTPNAGFISNTFATRPVNPVSPSGVSSFLVLDAFARALPHALRSNESRSGIRVRLVIIGEVGGVWTAVRNSTVGWSLESDHQLDAGAVVTIMQDLAGRLFTKGVAPNEIASRICVERDCVLAAALIQLVPVVA